MGPTVDALKRLIIAIKGEGTINDVKGNTIPEVIDALTEAYIASKEEDE